MYIELYIPISMLLSKEDRENKYFKLINLIFGNLVISLFSGGKQLF